MRPSPTPSPELRPWRECSRIRQALPPLRITPASLAAQMMNRLKLRKHMKAKFAVLVAIVAAPALLFGFSNGGVTVTINNVGSKPLQSVVVQATGYSRSLGNIAAGASKRIEVVPSGESHLEVEHDGGPRLVVN